MVEGEEDKEEIMVGDALLKKHSIMNIIKDTLSIIIIILIILIAFAYEKYKSQWITITIEDVMYGVIDEPIKLKLHTGDIFKTEDFPQVPEHLDFCGSFDSWCIYYPERDYYETLYDDYSEFTKSCIVRPLYSISDPEKFLTNEDEKNVYSTETVVIDTSKWITVTFDDVEDYSDYIGHKVLEHPITVTIHPGQTVDFPEVPDPLWEGSLTRFSTWYAMDESGAANAIEEDYRFYKSMIVFPSYVPTED